uniref:Beta-sarcoglycan n=1 Tax=Steinernema glaseri TaxID=37863 RepID=A0A1I7ZPH6_9BILA
MLAGGPAYLRRESESREYPVHQESFEESDDGGKMDNDYVTGLRRKKLIILLIALSILAILSVTILALNIMIIRALRMNVRGMKALEITKMQVRDPLAPEYYRETPVVRFMEKADLGHVILESGRVEGKGDKSLKVEGSRVILAGNGNITRMVLQEGSCRLDGADTFKVIDTTGKTLFDAKNPAVTVDHRIKTIATNYIITNKIRSPVNENLQFTVDNLILRGNQGVKSDSKTFNATAGTSLTLKTSGDGAIRLNARKMTMGTKFQTLPISASPALTASIDAFRVCVCISSHRPRLFTVQGNKPCHAPPAICG